MHNLFLNNQCQKTLPVKVDQGGQTANQAEDHREREKGTWKENQDGRNDGRSLIYEKKNK